MDVAAGSRLGSIRLVGVLAVTQLIGWGTTFELPSVLAQQFGGDLALSPEVVFGGLTVMMAFGAVTGPALADWIRRLGAARVLAIGSVVTAVGLALLAAAQGVVGYFAAWSAIGLGTSLALSVPAHAAVVERRGRDARAAIGVLMIFTGLSSAIFWPVVSGVEQLVGWRATCLIGAGLHLGVCLPLHLVGLPARRAATDAAAATTAAMATVPIALSHDDRRRVFALIAVFSVSYSFVAYGLSPTLLEVLRRSGASPALALQLGSMRSVLGISARAVDLGLGRRSTPVTTALVAAVAMLTALALLVSTGGSAATLVGFIVLYGVGSGVAAVARVLLPLAFFSAEDFARHSGRLALPLNIANAIAPVVFAAVLERGGVGALAVGASGLMAIATAAAVLMARLERSAAR